MWPRGYEGFRGYDLPGAEKGQEEGVEANIGGAHIVSMLCLAGLDRAVCLVISTRNI